MKEISSFTRYVIFLTKTNLPITPIIYIIYIGLNNIFLVLFTNIFLYTTMTYMHTCMYIYVCIMCICVYVCIHVGMYVYMYACMCICVYVHVCMYTFMYIYIHMYTYMYVYMNTTNQERLNEIS